MRHFYEGFGWEKIPLLIVSWETAELIKYASNSFLALKVGFINEITNLCDVSGANIQEVSHGMGLDHRIGPDFLRPGPGYGGSCFPKDTEALVYLARSAGVDLSLIQTLIKSNSLRKKDMAQRIVAALGGDVRGKKIAIWGVTFKAKTDDLRESPSLVILPLLQEAGALLRVYDPQGSEKGSQIFEGVSWCLNPYEAASEAEAVVVLTEWDVFKTVDWNLLKKTLKDPLIIDLRNLYDPLLLRSLGFKYKGLGCE
jgi:UDPglucose 6-dehydrogenase